MTTEQAKPAIASDEEIAWDVEGMYDPNGHCVFCGECVVDTGSGIPWAGEPHDEDCAINQPMFKSILARISADKQKIQAHEETIRELVEAGERVGFWYSERDKNEVSGGLSKALDNFGVLLAKLKENKQ